MLKTQGRHASRLFSVLKPMWWNKLPLTVQTAEALTTATSMQPALHPFRTNTSSKTFYPNSSLTGFGLMLLLDFVPELGCLNCEALL